MIFKFLQNYRINRMLKKQSDVIEILEHASTKNIFDRHTSKMIHGVLNISKLKVRDVMVTRAKMNVIKETESFKGIIRIINDTRHSRYPVIAENKDHVVGLLLAKDLIGSNSKVNLKDVIRPAMLTPEGRRVDSLLHDFQERRNHMAIVVNEYGEVSGLVTIENIIEEIVGDIEDEHDADDDNATVIRVHSPGCYIVSGLTPLDAFNEFFHVNYTDNFLHTFCGYLTQRLGRIPEENESFNFDDFKIKILAADERRIKKIEVTVLNKNKKS